MKIQNLVATEILDSRANPTIAIELTLATGEKGFFMVPSGASTGKFESFELRDDDQNRYNGKGVLKAKDHIENKIFNHVKDKEIHSQSELDHILIDLDGTPKKTNLGVNAILPVSMAFSKACANFFKINYYQYLRNLHNNILPIKKTQRQKKDILAFGTNKVDKDNSSNLQQLTLPIPLINVINGGVHADNNLDFQEFMIVPTLGSNFAEAIRASVEVFTALKSRLRQDGFSVNVGDEGGFAPNLSSNQHALDILLKSIFDAGFTPQKEFFISLDCAASEYYKDGKYLLNSGNGAVSSSQKIDMLLKLCDNYPLFSVEDPLDQEDLPAWAKLSKIAKRSLKTNKLQIIGDDLFVSNSKLLELGIKNGIANSVLVKINQIGTLTETLDTIVMAKKHSYDTVISHRSGETEDTTIADLAVGFATRQIKTGSVCRSERTAKYNRLIQIEKELGDNAYYGGAELSEFLNKNI